MPNTFGHISVLVAVLNVMGLATIMGGVAAYFRKAHQLSVVRDPVLLTWVGLQLYFHIMMWWRLYGLQVVDGFTFFHYLFLLAGPMCLYFASLLLLSEPDDDNVVDMPAHLARIRSKFFLFEAAFWIWAVLIGPIALGAWGNAWPFWIVMVVICVGLAATRNRRTSLALTVSATAVQIAFICIVALKLRGT